MKHRWRLHVVDLPTESGARVPLPKEERHHAARVLRLQAGDDVWLFDGRGVEWRARLVEDLAGSGVTAAELVEPLVDPVESPLRVVLYQALARPDRLEWVLQKGTELGVAAFRLWPAERSDAAAPRPNKLERWERILIEACKQSGRRVIPELTLVDALPSPTDGVVACLLSVPNDDGEASHGKAPPEDATPGEVWLGVGPESGLSAEESTRARAEGWLPVGLGPRILRTETAGVVATTWAQLRWGDLEAR